MVLVHRHFLKPRNVSSNKKKREQKTMKFPNLIYKINWRIILLHIVATIFIILCAQQFAKLNDIEIIKLVDKYGAENALKQLQKDTNYPSRISDFLLWNSISNLIGLLTAFILSFIIIIKKKMFWLNSLIIFILGLLFIRLGLFKNQIINTLFYSFGDLFPNFGLLYKYIINGTILLIFALLIFFNRWINNFALNYLSNKKDTETKLI